MTDRELMQMALEALDCIYSPLHVREINKVGAAMTALRERLARQEPNSSAGTQVSKVWWDGERLMAEPIPLEQMYKPAPQEQWIDEMREVPEHVWPARQEQEQEPPQDGPICEGWQLRVADGHEGYGVYAHMTEYPEEGAVHLLSLARQEQKQEPVAWMVEDTDGRHFIFRLEKPVVREGEKLTPLYTAPQREWQGLTDEEAMQIIDDARHGSTSGFGFMRVVRAVEAKLRELNR